MEKKTKSKKSLPFWAKSDFIVFQIILILRFIFLLGESVFLFFFVWSPLPWVLLGMSILYLVAFIGIIKRREWGLIISLIVILSDLFSGVALSVLSLGLGDIIGILFDLLLLSFLYKLCKGEVVEFT